MSIKREIADFLQANRDTYLCELCLAAQLSADLPAVKLAAQELGRSPGFRLDTAACFVCRRRRRVLGAPRSVPSRTRE